MQSAVCRQTHGYNTRSKSKQKQRETSQDTKVNNRGNPQQQAGRRSSRKSTGGWNLVYNLVVLRRKQLADPDTLVSMIKAYLKGQQREWDKHLGCLAAAYRATPHESTGFTPNMLMFGREARLPIEVILGIGATSTGEEVASYGDYVNSLKERMQVAHDLASKHLGRNALRKKEFYDAKKNLNKYNRGDLVWYATECKQLHTAPKLRVPFQGPYLVLDRLGDLLFKIQLDEKGKQKIVHHDKLNHMRGSMFHHGWRQH